MRQIFTKIATREVAIVVAIFLFGIAFRLWFISLAPQPFIYDQEEYQFYTYKMFYQNIFSSHTYRSYPYPLFLTFIYKFVGYGNHEAVFFVQAVIDSLIGVLTYLFLRYGFRNRKAAWVGLILYSINPFTSGYVGVVLSEILSAFFIVATLAVGAMFLRRPTRGVGVALGIASGMAAETRNAAFLWALIPLGLLLIFVPFTRHRRSYVAVAFGLILTVLYPLYVNWRDFREINITTVDSFYAKEFYNGVVFRRLPPFTIDYPWEARIMFGEYYSEFYPERTSAQRRAMAKKYFRKTWEVITNDPWDYINVRFEKMWYMWQKENIFFFEEPGYEDHKAYTYALNLVILGLALSGFVIQGRTAFFEGILCRRTMKKVFQSTHSDVSSYLWWCVIGTVVYGTLVFSFTHAEYRITIPFYPQLFLGVSLGVVSLWQVISRAIVSSR